MADALYDVAIIGGGPAGSIAAASLSLAGHKVAVFEREKFPRFHIGESLLPFSMEAFERLGLMPKLEAAGFVSKYGAEITSDCGSTEIRFYFKDGFRSKRSTALQLERSKFDKILLDHARECGADVREEVTVDDIALQPGRQRLKISGPAQPVEDIEAEYLLDCSGRHSVIGTRAPKHFALYERRLAKVMSLYLRFVYSWYRQEFVETVLAPREFFQVVPAVNAVLAGNVGRSFALRWRIWLFHLVVGIQRVIPISPRLPLARKPS